MGKPMQTSVGHRPLSYFETRFSCEEWENYIYGSLLLPLLKEGQKELGGGGRWMVKRVVRNGKGQSATPGHEGGEDRGKGRASLGVLYISCSLALFCPSQSLQL